VCKSHRPVFADCGGRAPSTTTHHPWIEKGNIKVRVNHIIAWQMLPTIDTTLIIKENIQNGNGTTVITTLNLAFCVR